jgi:hypothetical protein
MRLLRRAVALALALVLAAVLARAAHVHRVSIAAAPFGAHELWVDRGRAAPDAPCRIDIVLPLRNHALIDEHVRAVSDPAAGRGSAAAHWDVQRIGALASADESDVRAVLDWIASVDVAGELDVHVRSVRSYVRVRGPVRAIERLFGCEMHRFEHPLARGHVVLRARGTYALPSAIHARIALLAGLDDYPVVPAEPLLFRPRPVDGRRATDAVERRADARGSSAAAMTCDAGREALAGRRGDGGDDDGRGAAHSLPPGTDGTPRSVWPVGLSARELAAGADVFAGPSSPAAEMLAQLVCGNSERGMLRVFIPSLDADVVRRGEASLRVSFAHCRPRPADDVDGAPGDSPAEGEADGACAASSSTQLAVDTLSACRRVGRAGSALVCEYDVPTPLFQHTRVRVALVVAGSGVGAERDVVAASVVDCAFPGVWSTPARSAQLYHVPGAGGAACAVYERGECRLGGPDDLGFVLVPAHAGSACEDGEACALAPETALALIGMRALGKGVDRYLALHGLAAPQRALDDGRDTKRVAVRAAAGASVQLAAGAAGARGIAPMVVVPDASVSSQVQVLVDLLDDPSAPLVLVLSWSVCEHAPGVAAANDVLRLLALTNHTIVAPSGDLGFAGCGDVHVCRAGADGHADARTRCANAAVFPASSPYVLAVGGTQLSDAATPFEAKQRAARPPSAASSAYIGEVRSSGANVRTCVGAPRLSAPAGCGKPGERVGGVERWRILALVRRATASAAARGRVRSPGGAPACSRARAHAAQRVRDGTGAAWHAWLPGRRAPRAQPPRDLWRGWRSRCVRAVRALV